MIRCVGWILAPLRQSYYSLSTAAGTVMLILQDTPDDNGDPSAEFNGLIEMLRGSFQADRR